MAINNEKAYVLGLLVGGGTIANGTFSITMPFDKWGADPSTASAISRDLLTKVRKLFSDGYGLGIDYTIDNAGGWNLSPLDNAPIAEIESDLDSLGLPKTGTLLNSVSLTQAKSQLSRIQTELFLAGIFDARGSLAESHRRFNDSAPVVSIEIPGSTMNFDFVVQLCAWLTDLGSTTDQILYNHPCQHSGRDPTYSGWKKGFKLRFLAKSFLSTHSFAMKAKASNLTSLASRQTTEEQVGCEMRPISFSRVSIHKDIGYATLPPEVRNKLFFHYHHICAAMGCPHAPVDKIKEELKNVKNYAFAFPRLSKGSYESIAAEHEDLVLCNYPGSTVTTNIISCQNIVEYLSSTYYPDLEVGLAYLLADKLSGKRTRGSKDLILEANALVKLEMRVIDDQDRASVFIGNKAKDRGILVSSPSGTANQSALNSKIRIQGIDVHVI